MATLTKQERIERVKAWAKENYDNGADYIVECYGDEEIAEAFLQDWEGNELATMDEVMARVKQSVAWREEQRQEIQSTIW